MARAAALKTIHMHLDRDRFYFQIKKSYEQEKAQPEREFLSKIEVLKKLN